ncbi:unnamed protein product [Cyprideis torosa]|uniref:Uncharacterized protein n=1 Tax=Cyprideis torosa TaxID=163714 RepID=A0A7R8W881_9CRUS|nr:unnamed protein product [Cyprideis torosa]CAG0882934.1 unnamed protein product [Cyprideis torosa]
MLDFATGFRIRGSGVHCASVSKIKHQRIFTEDQRRKAWIYAFLHCSFARRGQLDSILPKIQSLVTRGPPAESNVP